MKFNLSWEKSLKSALFFVKYTYSNIIVFVCFLTVQFFFTFVSTFETIIDVDVSSYIFRHFDHNSLNHRKCFFQFGKCVDIKNSLTEFYSVTTLFRFYHIKLHVALLPYKITNTCRSTVLKSIVSIKYRKLIHIHFHRSQIIR